MAAEPEPAKKEEMQRKTTAETSEDSVVEDEESPEETVPAPEVSIPLICSVNPMLILG